ncbi:MazG-like family protein [Schnuerera sp. xch1]|uniref:MazG-like family protein n=1 Tax=Schnuerera sp. xch1 TaxID=2874283 RepID=UPI001CBB017F|nr:MazG-like family protein [Schnuerera sp. xch1]MBZ2175410.1 MazG-like family protein [Schnuerera sp. xch1]
MDEKREVDIIKNVRTIEWLKSELLTSVAYLYKTLSEGEDDTNKDLEDTISNIMLLSFLLSKRLGLDYENISSNLEDKIRLNILEDHKIEKWYGDLSELLEFIKSKQE